MDHPLQTHLNSLRQKPASSLSYPETLTFQMLKDLEELQHEGASGEEMQHHISATMAKLEQHDKDINKTLERYYLEQRKKDVQDLLSTVQAFEKKLNSMKIQTKDSGDEWEKVEKA